jgi:hypothetical protein
MKAVEGKMELTGLTPDFELRLLTCFIQCYWHKGGLWILLRSTHFIQHFFVRPTQQGYTSKENNLFLYAVLCLEVFALSESVVSTAREHLFNEACKIAKKRFRKVRDLRIGIRLSTCMICKFRPLLSVNKLWDEIQFFRRYRKYSLGPNFRVLFFLKFAPLVLCKGIIDF